MPGGGRVWELGRALAAHAEEAGQEWSHAGQKLLIFWGRGGQIKCRVLQHSADDDLFLISMLRQKGLWQGLALVA